MAACTSSTFSRRSCSRSSGDVSMRKLPSGAGTNTPVRVRWLRGFVEVQIGQRQPMTGTPTLVPVPSRISSRLKRALRELAHAVGADEQQPRGERVIHAIEVVFDLSSN